MQLYDNGTLLAEANRLTQISGNGRLRRSDGSFIDIGGSTGGYTRAVLYDWEPPDVTEFEPNEPGDVSQFAGTHERTGPIIHEHAETSDSDKIHEIADNEWYSQKMNQLHSNFVFGTVGGQ